MIIKHTSSPVITSGDMEDSKMGIDPDNSDFVASLLRDRIYTDKILAPIRELICNAVDANIEANSDKLVYVDMTSNDNRYIWSVRDHGLGLSEDDVRNVFGRIGSSKKRNCNKQIGMYGIGSLSPFSYTDTYHIVSHHNGVKYTYCATLVAGSQAVSVGQLYKVSEEPTTETGIEVSFDVTQDYCSFGEKTIEFVNNFLPDSKIQYTDSWGSIHIPHIPLLKYEENGYVFNKYDADTNHIFIRMGGVVYRKSYNKCGTLLGTVCVDVPIGKLTVPPSRESLDDSKSNQRVLDEIETIIINIYNDDRKSIKLPKFGSLLCQSGTSNFGNMDGEWFSHKLTNIFPETYRLSRRIDRFFDNRYIKPDKNGMYNIFVLPNNTANKSWKARLHNFLVSSGGYMTMDGDFETIGFESNTSLDLSDCVFVNVKKMKLPPLKPSSKKIDGGPIRYYVNNISECNQFTADELFEYTKNSIYDDINWSDSENLNRFDLDRRSIAMIKGFGKNNTFWTTGSVKMYNELINLGFISVKSMEYESLMKKIKSKETEIMDLAANERYIKRVLFGIKPLTQVTKLVTKNYGKLTRLDKVKKLILSENSIRSRILKSIDDYSYNSEMTRKDLRTILNLK